MGAVATTPQRVTVHYYTWPLKYQASCNECQWQAPAKRISMGKAQADARLHKAVSHR